MSLGYGDQGPLSLAEALVPKGGAAPPAVPVKFVADQRRPVRVRPAAQARPGTASARADACSTRTATA